MQSDDPTIRDFNVVMRGYDRAEVDRHLSTVARTLASARARIAELEAAVEAASVEHGDRPALDAGAPPRERFGALGEETARILVVAEETAREMTERAARQVDAELAAAERAARERVDAASEHAARVVFEAERHRDSIAAEMAHRRLEEERELNRIAGVRDELVAGLRAAVDSTTGAMDDLVDDLADDGGDDVVDLDLGPVAATTGDGAATVAMAPGAHDDQAHDDQAHDDQADDDEAHDDQVPDDQRLSQTASDDSAGGSTAPADGDPGEDAATDDAARLGDTADLTGSADVIVIDAVVEPTDDTGHDSSAPPRVSVHSIVTTDTVVPHEEGLAPSARRDRSLATVRSQALRSVRRSLQDLQNGVLRDVRDRPTSEVGAVLPDGDAEGALATAAQDGMREAVLAGVVDGALMAGVTVTATPDAATVEDVSSRFADDMLAELRTTLSPSLRAGIDAEEPGASLSERVGEVFRDLKGPVVETVLDRHLIRAYGLATLSSWHELDVERVEWVLAEESRCPEGRCRANAAEGSVRVGGEFPSGDAVPQVHDGCTCALAPAAG